MNYEWEMIPGGGLSALDGIEAAGIHCGLKNSSKKDLALIFCREPAIAAGVFTKNKFKAAPLLVTEKHIRNPVRAIVVNSGNANACTGERGLDDALSMAGAVARELKIKAGEVLVASTGIIGVYLPMDKILAGIRTAAKSFSPQGGEDAARAIMTTDTVPKQYACRVRTAEGSFRIAGMAKGSGMICPDMATMLAFIATDLEVSRELLQKALHEAVDQSFNLITVDGDTSTNDMVILLATGKAGLKIKKEEDPLWPLFRTAMAQFCRELATMIIADGEGVTKMVKLTIRGLPDYETGRKMARAVLNSLLVKTALFGEDANWGRIITALGYSGADFIPGQVDIFLGDVQTTAGGKGLIFDESAAKKVLGQQEIPLCVDLHLGSEELVAWGCDLGYEYITINSAYRS